MDIYSIATGEIQENAYVIVNDGNAIIVDPGADGDVILKYINELGAEPRHILITHGHFDHIGAVAFLCKQGAKVYMSRTDYDDLRARGFKSGLFFGEDTQEFCVDTFVNDGDELHLSGLCVNVISTPGHTPGGVCYRIDNVIFTGDTLFRSSIGRTDLPGGDEKTLFASIKKLLSIDGDLIILPGHGPKSTLSFEREYNPYAR